MELEAAAATLAEPSISDEAGVGGVNGELIIGSEAGVEVPASARRDEYSLKKGDDRYKLRNGREIYEEKAYLVGVERKMMKTIHSPWKGRSKN